MRIMTMEIWNRGKEGFLYTDVISSGIIKKDKLEEKRKKI